jgi:hypothetical protein
MTDFEKATLEQLVFFYAKTETDIERLLQCEVMKKKAIAYVRSWNEQRIKLGLIPW